MGRLLVAYIELTDFGSYAGVQRLMLGGRGAVAVVGDNGAGKSTAVAKALTWCLYGRCPPERMGADTKALGGKDVVREGATACRVVVGLTCDPAVGDPESPGTCILGYRVVRERNVTGADRLVIEVEDAAGAEPDYGHEQDDVDRLLGATYDVFVRTVVRGQGDPWNFAEATDARKREIVDAVSGAAALGVPYERVIEVRKRLETAEGSYATRARDAASRVDREDPLTFEAAAMAWDAARDLRVKAAHDALAAAGRGIEEADALDLVAEETARQTAAVTRRKPGVDFRPYDDAITPLAAEHRRCDGALERAKAAFEIAHRCVIGQACPTCNEVVPATARIAVQQSATTQAVVDAEQALHAAAEGWGAALRTKQEASDWLRAAEAAWRAEVAAIPVATGGHSAAAIRVRDAAQETAEAEERAENPHRRVAVEVAARRVMAEREHAALEEARALVARRVVVARAWEETLAPRGARAHLAGAVLAAIEYEANRWLSVLSNGAMSVAFPATRTTGKGGVREEICTIVTAALPGGVRAARPLLSYSGGERSRVNIAVDLGVAAAAGRGGGLALSLLVLDEESLSGLDEAGKAAVIGALGEAGVADVVLVDHDPRAAGRLGRTVVARRGDDGWSTLAEEIEP